ncbi:MAG: nicotinate phosphoribosyltransferase [Firmicutes bacterium]|nr:nicotinate phosphoribosyltransferase [Bacillota bacterium]
MKKTISFEEVKEYKPQKKRFFSATGEEIVQGLTTDIYFLKTKRILEEVGKGRTVVAAEVFARRGGVFAGLDELQLLLEGTGVELWALAEGEEFEANEPVLHIKGKYNAFGLYETPLLGILASSSGWATATRECVEAAGGKPVLCFGARHVHPAVAPAMERIAIKAGATAASCVLGAKLAGKEPSGTVPHALFLIIGDSVEAARAYDEIMPPDSPRTILIDTFKDEAEEALRVAEALGERLEGIRLDTPSERGGVTADLVKEVRFRLDAAGFNHVKIFASGGLYPEKIRELSTAGVDAFGVGSYISGAKPIDMTMDIKEVDGKPVAKRGRLPGLRLNPRLRYLGKL